MAKATRDMRLESRTARAKLRIDHDPYWRLISQALYLGYRKGPRGGKWVARHYSGGKYVKHVLGLADDHRDSNGYDVLSYFEAQGKARQFADNLTSHKLGDGRKTPYTVGDAIPYYMEWFGAHRKSLYQTWHAIKGHILPAFEKKLVSELTTQEIRKWHEGLAFSPARLRSKKTAFRRIKKIADGDMDGIRRRKSTANRILVILKAALNHAWREGHVKS